MSLVNSVYDHVIQTYVCRLLYQVRDAAMTEIESDPSSVTAIEENKELQKCTENQVVGMEVEESPCVGAASG